jgi:hypothetical protein
MIISGGCDIDKSYEGPKLTLEDGKYKITQEFVEGMIQWFKDGKALPKRYVWEIVLAAHAAFIKHDSLVDLKVGEGQTVDVIGDVHGKRAHTTEMKMKGIQTGVLCRTVLRRHALVLTDGIPFGVTLLAHERRSCRSRVLVNRGHLDCVCLEMCVTNLISF